MIHLGEIGRRLHALWHRSRLARNLDDEMELHQALRREQLQEEMPRSSDVAVAARRRFGNPLRLREEAMDAWGWRWLEQLTQDVRFAVRALTRNPAFTAMAIGTFALGIGANTAIFTVVSGVVLRPLPFAEPGRLIQIYGTSPLSPSNGPVPNVETFRRANTSLEAIAGYEVTARYLRRTERPERVMAVRAERDFFPILGVPPLRGRTFGPGDALTVAVVSERFWNTQLHGDPSAIGSVLTVDGQSFTIVGVMPDAFQFPYRAASLLTGVDSTGRTDLWLPMDPPGHRYAQMSAVIGRLRPNTPAATAQAELDAIARQLEGQDPDANRGRGVRVVPLSAAVVSPAVRQPLFLLFGAVGLLLLLACSNVSSLLLVRQALRSREIAVRRALGAGRLRLIRQFLTESLLMSIAAAGVGLILAAWARRYLLQIAGVRMPRVHEVALDWRVFAFLVATCGLIGLGLSLAATLSASGADSRSALQETSGHNTMGVGSRRLRDGLIVAEVAVAFVLAVGAAVLIREMVRLQHTDPGLVASNVMTFHVGQDPRVTTDVNQFYDIADRVEQLPGVRAAGFTQLLPLQNWGWTANSRNFQVRGRPPTPTEFPIELRFVTPGYFRALGIPVRGRTFTRQDDQHAPAVIIINDALARKTLAGQDPIGQGINDNRTIVGTVGDIRQAHLDRPSVPELYTPMAQNWAQVSELGLTLVVSTAAHAEQIIEPVRAVVHEVNPNLAVFGIKTMAAVMEDSLSDLTIYLWLIAAVAGLALALASTGTYAVIAHMASARTREFAIRVALGADRNRVTGLLIGEGARLTAIGLAIGIVGVAAGGRLVQGLPVTVRPPDVVTIAPIAALITAAALVACLVPARRAAMRDPISVLRNE